MELVAQVDAGDDIGVLVEATGRGRSSTSPTPTW